MKFRLLLCLLVTCLAVCGTLSGQSKHSHPSEQSSFSAEEASVKKPVTIPPDVWAILVKDDMVKKMAENEDHRWKKFHRHGFQLQPFI